MNSENKAEMILSDDFMEVIDSAITSRLQFGLIELLIRKGILNAGEIHKILDDILVGAGNILTNVSTDCPASGELIKDLALKRFNEIVKAIKQKVDQSSKT